MNKIKRTRGNDACSYHVRYGTATDTDKGHQTGTASLVNIGQLGTVNIGDKSESGTWLKNIGK